ncbi:hypothetical protein HU200_033580 [Digitaria exilis]|uniref:Uncharacterized protein n=1 Tax=Digitaria exilis TaxID=1010633 RepID=A0A835BUZ5_9POAL|nr:hypothetical protein HU200_033580 [Digitaria exilis]
MTAPPRGEHPPKRDHPRLPSPQGGELSAASVRPSRMRPKKQQPRASPASPVVVRRSLRTRGISPGESSVSPGSNTAPATLPSPTKPRTTQFSSSLASSLRDSTAAEPLHRTKGGICTADWFDARRLVLRPANVRRVVPGRILSVWILPLTDRTVVVAGNKLGHIGFWDVDGLVEDEDGDSADRVFEYFPHRGPVGYALWRLNGP